MKTRMASVSSVRFPCWRCCRRLLATVVDAKTKIENLDDLPRFSYPVEGSVVGVITSDDAFNEFAAKVRTDIEGVLDEYEIDDAATLQGYYGVLSRLDLMNGDYEGALARSRTDPRPREQRGGQAHDRPLRQGVDRRAE